MSEVEEIKTPAPGEKTMKVKISVPKIIVDNPMVKWTTADGSWSQETPLDSMIVRYMTGRYDAWVEVTMSNLKIISMKPISETEYLASAPQ